MTSDLEKIHSFLSKHHVLSLATSNIQELSVCSLFYAYACEENLFIVASSEDTRHMQDIKTNKKVAGNILLETEEVGKIQGVQFRGTFSELHDSKLKDLYLDAFAYARDRNPRFWKIEVEYFKMTDNTLGFGKKIIWKDSSQ